MLAWKNGIETSADYPPSLRVISFRRQLVNTPTSISNLVSPLLLILVGDLEWDKLIFDVRDSLLRSGKTVLARLILLAFEGVNLYLELELAALETLNVLGGGFASYTDTVGYELATDHILDCRRVRELTLHMPRRPDQ